MLGFLRTGFICWSFVSVRELYGRGISHPGGTSRFDLFLIGHDVCVLGNDLFLFRNDVFLVGHDLFLFGDDTFL